ncbi:hypothetical protein ANCCAN_05909, partial [Ancylostoma caninum]
VYSNGSRYVTSQGDLVVIEATRDSFGDYKVVASVDGLNEAVSNLFTVRPSQNSGGLFDGLSIVYFSDDRTIFSSSNAQKSGEAFDCVASRRDGARTRWFLDGAAISGTETGVELSQNNRRLTLSVPDVLGKGRSEHKLDCKVVAESGRAFDQRSLKINVIEGPELRALPAEEFRPLGSELNLQCSQKKKNGVPPTTKWYFNGREVSSLEGFFLLSSNIFSARFRPSFLSQFR